MLSLHQYIPRSRANGPGERAVIWVQGCPRRCTGCWNPDSLAFDGRAPTTVESLVERIASTKGLSGVTFSGGEPFSQAAPLAELARQLRSRMGEDFSVVCFTGHTIEQIRKGAERSKPEWGALLTEVDLLVDGAYDERQRSLGLPLRGSANQRLHFLTDRICEEDVTPSVAEFTLSLDGDLTQTGYPEFPDAVDVFAAVRKLQEGVLT